ncbi:MAG: hypothetical protein ACYCUE_01035 [Steroidobacteraceae bacterium]
MKTQLALLGCLALAWNVANAGVNCAKAPFGESLAQFGRDEFRLGMLAATRDDLHRSAPPPALLRQIERAMRGACRAKFYGDNLARYSRLGVSPHALKTRSVGSLAALTVDWRGRNRRGALGRAPLSRASRGPASTARGMAAGGRRFAPPPAGKPLVAVTTSFPACPRKVDFQSLLSVALIDKSEWASAEAKGRRHGCIELRAGERVYPLRRERWTGLIKVRPAGRARTYWTDAVAVK